jgi:hypothetical protein
MTARLQNIDTAGELCFVVYVFLCWISIRLKELVLKCPHSYKLERFPCEIILELPFLISWHITPFRDMAVPPTLVHKCHLMNFFVLGPFLSSGIQLINK